MEASQWIISTWVQQFVTSQGWDPLGSEGTDRIQLFPLPFIYPLAYFRNLVDHWYLPTNTKRKTDAGTAFAKPGLTDSVPDWHVTAQLIVHGLKVGVVILETLCPEQNLHKVDNFLTNVVRSNFKIKFTQNNIHIILNY